MLSSITSLLNSLNIQDNETNFKLIDVVPKRYSLQLTIGKRVSLSDLLKVAYGKYEVVLDDEAILEKSFPRISDEMVFEPIQNVIESNYPPVFSRAALFARLVTLLQGKSGVNLSVINVIVRLLNDDILPCFSSDENAGSELVNALYGVGDCFVNNVKVSIGEAFASFDIIPITLSTTEAETLISSRFFYTGVVCLLTAVTSSIGILIDPVSALSIEYYGSISIDSFDSSVYENNRQQRGQVTAANNLRLLLDGSRRLISSTETSNNPQSLLYKSIPQINGSIQETLVSITKSLEIDLNSVEDGNLNVSKPIVFEPYPAKLAISSIISSLNLIINAANDRLSIFLPSYSSNSSPVSSFGSHVELISAYALILRATDVLTQEIQFILTKFQEIDPISNEGPTSDQAPDDSSLDKPDKSSFKPESNDANLTPEQLAKAEAKRKAKAEKAAAKAAAKEAKKLTVKGSSLILGQGTSQIRNFLSTQCNHDFIVNHIELYRLINPWNNSDSNDQKSAKYSSDTKSLRLFTLDIIEKLNSNAIGKRKPKIAKGTRDYGPEQMRIREQVFSIIKRVFKRHGGVEIDTPVFELKEILTGKYGEDSKLIYDLADQGGELLSLRYDLTVPFARFLAMNSVGNIKRYHIAKVYRRDQPQLARGRYREFYQCDFDIAGSYNLMIPDAEVITIANEILLELPLIGKFLIKLNHRKILDAIFEICGVPHDKFRPICSSVDKLDKMSWEDVKKEMVLEKGLNEDVADKIGIFVNRCGSPKVLLQEFLDEKIFGDHVAANQALSELGLLFTYLDAMGSLVNVSFDLSLARGLDYYTGVIYEIVLIDGVSQVGSIAAGGRYDTLVGMFSTSGIQTPCVGVSIGVERIFAIMEKRANEANLFNSSIIQVFIASIGSGFIPQRMKIARLLWQSNISAEYSHQDNPKFKKQLDEALERQIPFMVVFGEDEIARNFVKVKNMKTHTEDEVEIGKLVEYLISAGCS